MAPCTRRGDVTGLSGVRQGGMRNSEHGSMHPPTVYRDYDPSPKPLLVAVRQGGARNSEDGFDLSDAAGVIPRAIHQIFTTLDAHGAEYTVKCSFLELYQARPALELRGG